MLFSGCKTSDPQPEKPGNEVVDPGNGNTNPVNPGDNKDPEPPIDEEGALKEGYVYYLDSEGKEISKEPIGSSASFTSEGYILFYATDLEGFSASDFHSKDLTESGAQLVVAGLIMPISNGEAIDITSTEDRFQFAFISNGINFEISNRQLDAAISEGHMTLSADRVNLIAHLEADFTMEDGTHIAFKIKADYTSGGEIDNVIEFADWGLCLCRSAFYIEPATEGHEPLLIFCPPYFEYASDLPTSIFYAKLEAKSELFDGETHSIAELTNTGDLSLSVWHGESGKDEEHWPVVKGNIRMVKNSVHNYSVEVVGGATSAFSGRMPFNLNYSGEFQDGSIQKPLPDNKFIVNRTDEHIIGSVVIDLQKSEEISYIYICEESGVKSVEQMQSLNSVKVTVSRTFLAGAAGLSTDPNLAINYNGTEWSKAAGSDTGSYICDDLNFSTGWYSLRIRNFGTFTLDFNGTATILL